MHIDSTSLQGLHASNVVQQQADLTPAGATVQQWLDRQAKQQAWLVRELNRLRLERGITGRAGRSTLWRWMTGAALINIDDAALIEAITGTPIALWSQHAELVLPALAKPHAKRRATRRPPAAA